MKNNLLQGKKKHLLIIVAVLIAVFTILGCITSYISLGYSKSAGKYPAYNSQSYNGKLAWTEFTLNEYMGAVVNDLNTETARNKKLKLSSKWNPLFVSKATIKSSDDLISQLKNITIWYSKYQSMDLALASGDTTATKAKLYELIQYASDNDLTICKYFGLKQLGSVLADDKSVSIDNVLNVYDQVYWLARGGYITTHAQYGLLEELKSTSPSANTTPEIFNMYAGFLISSNRTDDAKLVANAALQRETAMQKPSVDPSVRINPDKLNQDIAQTYALLSYISSGAESKKNLALALQHDPTNKLALYIQDLFK